MPGSILSRSNPASVEVEDAGRRAAAAAANLEAARRRFESARLAADAMTRADAELRTFHEEILPRDLAGARALTFARLAALAADHGLLWVTTADLPTNDGHPFFERLNRVLEETGFDAYVEKLCAVFYAARMGRPSLRPGRYFRMLLIGYFEGLTPLYVKNARGSTTARSVRGELKALASLGSRSPRTVNHGRQPAARVLRCAPALRVTAAADRAGSPCGPAGRLALDPLPGSATPASHSVVAENRRQWDRVHLPDRGFAVARTIRKHAVGILAYLDTRMTERARGRTHPARPTG